MSRFLVESKGWWLKMRRLIHIKPVTFSIQMLKTLKCEWIFELKTKATIFCNTFSSNDTLIQGEENEYIEIGAIDVQQTCGPLPPEEDTAKILRALRIDSAISSDLQSIRMPRECADQIAKPFQWLAKFILQHNTWPRT